MSTSSELPIESGVLIVERATANDAETLLAIHEDVAHWLWCRDIRQWEPGTFPRQQLDVWIARGEAYLARLDGAAVAMLTLHWSDEETWGVMPEDAGYVHSLAVRRQYAGQGIGRALLAWTEREVAAAGKEYLRLDCMAQNAALRAYYEHAGFVERRDIAHDAWSTLYEKRVSRS
ncbi:MAG TPA: GNAT family N-acetyltransferase [Ktedonobacterales bacterium]